MVATSSIHDSRRNKPFQGHKEAHEVATTCALVLASIVMRGKIGPIVERGLLEGKVALVIGSARGLGRAYALRLARLGADVVINDVNLKAAEEFNERLTAPTVTDEVRKLGRRSS